MAARASEAAEEGAPDPHAPPRNPHLVGHAAAERAVLEAWSAGRFPHAWLLTGPRGVGKATLAHRIARFVLADSGTRQAAITAGDLAVPPEAPVFRRIAAGGHADFKRLDRGEKTQIPVESVRAAVDFTFMTAAEGGWKVVLIDAADDLNRAGANAILKALEEPPERALFLLVSHAPGRLLPTIRSRCRRLPLDTLPAETVAGLLQRYRPETSDEEAAALARLSEGSVGAAQELAAAGGLELFRTMTALLARPGDPDMDRLARLADRLGGKGGEAGFATLAGLVDWWFKRLIRAGATGEGPTPLDDGDAAAIAAMRRIGGVSDWIALRDRAVDLLGKAEPPANLDRRQLLYAVFATPPRAALAQA